VDRAAAFTAGRKRTPGALPKLLAVAADADAGPLHRANALGYLRAYADPRAVSTLVAALSSEHTVERMVAAASLQQPGGRPALLAALDDPRRSVRISALVSLVNLGGSDPGPEDQARLQRVGEEFAVLARMYEDDARIQADLGLVHLLNGHFDRAATALETSLSLEPGAAKPTFLLGFARLKQRRVGDARSLLKQVPASDPNYRTAQEWLKRVSAERQ
jgi:tetratricopeptide (TPR) repeat protein